MLRQFTTYDKGGSGEAVIISETERPGLFVIALAGKTIYLTEQDAEDIREILDTGYAYSSSPPRIRFTKEKSEEDVTEVRNHFGERNE